MSKPLTADEFLKKAFNDARNWFTADKKPGPPDASTPSKPNPGDPLKGAGTGGANGPG